VLPATLSISGAPKAFAEDGSLSDPKQHEQVLSLGRALAEHLARLG
jgi:hypothetical protein